MDQKPISANGHHAGIIPRENYYGFNKIMRPNIVASPEKAAKGKQKIDWVRRNMPILRQLEGEFREQQPFAGKRVLV